METLVTVRDVSERYKCSLPTARKYIRQCNPHMEKPLSTTEWAFREWETSRTVITGNKERRAQILKHCTERVIVPRKRG